MKVSSNMNFDTDGILYFQLTLVSGIFFGIATVVEMSMTLNCKYSVWTSSNLSCTLDGQRL